jgi:hypothetical protein
MYVTMYVHIRTSTYVSVVCVRTASCARMIKRGKCSCKRQFLNNLLDNKVGLVGEKDRGWREAGVGGGGEGIGGEADDKRFERNKVFFSRRDVVDSIPNKQSPLRTF